MNHQITLWTHSTMTMMLFIVFIACSNEETTSSGATDQMNTNGISVDSGVANGDMNQMIIDSGLIDGDANNMIIDSGVADGGGEPVITAMQEPRVHEAVQPIAKDIIRVVLREVDRPDSLVTSWSIQSNDDDAYRVAISPLGLAVKSKATELILNEDRTWFTGHIPEHEILLHLPSSMNAGATYTVSYGPLELSWRVPFDPSLDWTPSIKVNQLGYKPGVPGRVAVLSYWTHTLAPLSPSANDLSFHVVDVDGNTALSGTFTLRMARAADTDDAYNNNYTKADIFEADLSALNTPGSYFLVWDGVGRSPSFEISEHVYNHAFTTVFHALYHQRCGMALVEPYTQYTHEACHTDTLIRSSADVHLVGSDAFTAIAEGATGETVEAVGGYHDAGDYDRRNSHLRVVDELIDLYEINPNKFSHDDLGLPESGNNVPDILDEAIYGLGIFIGIQRPNGGVSEGVETTNYPGWDVMPEDDNQTQWYTYAEDPISTYRFAGAAAKAARVMVEFDTIKANLFLERALLAWNWAETNFPTNYNEATLKRMQQETAYAAAELFKTTGDVTYELRFQTTSPFADGNFDYRWSRFDGGFQWNRALYTYATTESANTDYKAAALGFLRERADFLVSSGEGNGYRLTKSRWSPVGYGSGTTPNAATHLFRAYELFGDSRYLEWGIYSCNANLGITQLGYVWTTGLGFRPIKSILHTPSMADGIDAPVPGITVYGPSRKEESNGILGFALAGYNPPIAEWPLMERYADLTYPPSTNEFTIYEQIAPTSFAFGYLTELTR
jgi:endoglucanase